MVQMTTGIPAREAVEIHQVLVVSTAHLAPKDVEILERLAESPDARVDLVVRPFEYGWTVIYTGWPSIGYLLAARFREAKLRDKRLAVIVGAAVEEYGCGWVQFDCDGPVYDEWQTFDW